MDMTSEKRFEELLAEMQRVGVDPNRFPAGITVRRDDALRVLMGLPDNAGPGAFLAGLRGDLERRTDTPKAWPPLGQEIARPAP